MHALFKARRKKGIALKPVALAVALALPNVGAFAASMQDVISTHAAQSIAEQYGRDSLYAFSPESRRFKPGQTQQIPACFHAAESRTGLGQLTRSHHRRCMASRTHLTCFRRTARNLTVVRAVTLAGNGL